VVLVAHLSLRLDPLGPRNDQRATRAAAIFRVALEHLEWRRERHRPTGRKVVVGLRATEDIQILHVLGQFIGIVVEELVLVDRAARAAFTRSAVVRAIEDDRVVELFALFEVVDEPAHLHIRVLGKSGVDLGHAREQLLLVRIERVPGTNGVARICNLLRKRIDRGELRILRQESLRDHARKNPLTISLVAVVKLTLVLVDVFLRCVVRRMVRAGTEPHEPRLRRIAGLLVANHLQRLIDEILGEVITLFRTIGLVDEFVVFDEVRIPLVSFAADEAVVTVETLLQRPFAAAGAGSDILFRHVVIFAEPERAPAGLLQNLADRRALRRKPATPTGESLRRFRNARTSIEMVIAAGQESRARRRAKRGRVPLGVHQPAVGKLLQRRHVDGTAHRRPGSQASVVVENDQDVGRSFRSSRQRIGTPIRFGIANIKLNDAVEFFLRHNLFLLWFSGVC